MRVAFSYLQELVRKGGPTPEGYPALDEIWQRVMASVREGRATDDERRSMWPGLGSAFYSLETMQGFGILKPHGYAGDFEMIDRIYTRRTTAEPSLVAWDEYFHAQRATEAVRNRKAYLINLMRQRMSRHAGVPFRVLSVGCGPAREFAGFRDADGGRLELVLLDRDARALDYARSVIGTEARGVRYLLQDAFRFRTGERYELIWSAGLFDYLSDSTFRRLLRSLYGLLAPGGLVTVGNFSPANPSRAYMEFGDWVLNYRSEDELRELAFSSGDGIGREQICVDREPEDVNLFLHVDRPV